MSCKDVASEIFNFIAAWLNEVIRTRSSHTVEAYKYAMNLYFRFLEEALLKKTKDLAWECFSRDNIEKWMKWLMERGNKPQTINLRLSNIRDFLSFVETRSPSIYGYLYHEAVRIKRIKVQRAEVKGVSDAAVEAILKSINTTTDAGARDFVLILFLNETGARLSEAISIKMKDVHTDSKGRMTVTVMGKGGYARTLYLTPVIARKLREYIQRFHNEKNDYETYLFFSKIKGRYSKISARAIQKRVKELALKAHAECEEVPLNLHPHNYRHAYGTRRIKQGKQIAVVQREMGHRCIQTTMTYIDTSSMIEQAQKNAEDENVRNIKPVWKSGDSLVMMYRRKFMT